MTAWLNNLCEEKKGSGIKTKFTPDEFLENTYSNCRFLVCDV
jgi:hypothetical protein